MARRKYDDNLFDGLGYDDWQEEDSKEVKSSTATPTESQEDKDVEYYNRMYTVLKKVEQQQERVESILRRNEDSMNKMQSLTTKQEQIAATLSVDSETLLNPVKIKFKEIVQEEANAFGSSIHEKAETESKLFDGLIQQSVKTGTDKIKQAITDETAKAVEKIKNTKEEKEENGRISVPTTVVYRYIVYMMGAISFAMWAGRDRLIEIFGSSGDAKIFMIIGCCGIIYQIGKDIWLFLKKIWDDYHDDKKKNW